MKIIKTIFLISLFNFMVVGSIVMAMNNKTSNETSVGLAIPTLVPEIITVTPSAKPTQKNRPVANKTTDPFAIIFSQKETAAPKTTTRPAQDSQIVSTPIPAQPVADNRCIIAIDGVRYDVSVFRNQHSGGDIFSCGTDMSAIFHGQHPNSFLQKMARYKI